MELGVVLVTRYEDMDDAEWMRHTDAQSIKIVRQLFGLPSLSAKSVQCVNKSCGKVFFTQTISGRRVEFLCSTCKRKAKDADHPLFPNTKVSSDFSDFT